MLKKLCLCTCIIYTQLKQGCKRGVKGIAVSLRMLDALFGSYTWIYGLQKRKEKTFYSQFIFYFILPLDDKIIGLALNDETFSDFEDGLHYFTAIEDEQELIITRNLKDFKSSKLPAMTAKQFIETFIILEREEIKRILLY